MDIMDRVDMLMERLEKAGVQFAEGQTVVVCNDGVALVDVSEDGFDLILCNNMVKLDYDLGITTEDVDQFKAVADYFNEMGE